MGDKFKETPIYYQNIVTRNNKKGDISKFKETPIYYQRSKSQNNQVQNEDLMVRISDKRESSRQNAQIRSNQFCKLFYDQKIDDFSDKQNSVEKEKAEDSNKWQLDDIVLQPETTYNVLDAFNFYYNKDYEQISHENAVDLEKEKSEDPTNGQSESDDESVRNENILNVFCLSYNNTDYDETSDDNMSDLINEKTGDNDNSQSDQEDIKPTTPTSPTSSKIPYYPIYNLFNSDKHSGGLVKKKPNDSNDGSLSNKFIEHEKHIEYENVTDFATENVEIFNTFSPSYTKDDNQIVYENVEDFVDEEVEDFVDEEVEDFVDEEVEHFVDEEVEDFVDEEVEDFVDEEVEDFYTSQSDDDGLQPEITYQNLNTSKIAHYTVYGSLNDDILVDFENTETEDSDNASLSNEEFSEPEDTCHIFNAFKLSYDKD